MGPGAHWDFNKMYMYRVFRATKIPGTRYAAGVIHRRLLPPELLNPRFGIRNEIPSMIRGWSKWRENCHLG